MHPQKLLLDIACWLTALGSNLLCSEAAAILRPGGLGSTKCRGLSFAAGSDAFTGARALVPNQNQLILKFIDFMP